MGRASRSPRLWPALLAVVLTLSLIVLWVSPAVAESEPSVPHPDVGLSRSGEEAELEPGSAVEPPVEPGDPGVCEPLQEGPEEPQPQAPGVEPTRLEPVERPAASVEPRALPAPAPAPLADGEAGCYYAEPGTGTYAENLCWLNFDGFKRGLEQALATPTLFDVDLGLPGGHRLTAVLHATRWPSGATSFPVGSIASPAFLGSNGFYMGVLGKPALEKTYTSVGHVIFLLKDIEITNADGELVSGYGLVVADAQSTDVGESIDWRTTGGDFKELPNSPSSPPGQPFGNSCSGVFQNNGATAKCKGSGIEDRTGTPMLVTKAPQSDAFEVEQDLDSSGRQAVAFAVMFGTAQATVKATDRIRSTDQFGVAFTAAELGSDDVTAVTGADGREAKTELTSILVDPTDPAELSFSEYGVVGDYSGSYARQWSCDRPNQDPFDPEGSGWEYPADASAPLPAKAPLPADSVVRFGETTSCSLTYTPPSLKLINVVDAEETGAPVDPTAFTLQALAQQTAPKTPEAEAGPEFELLVPGAASGDAVRTPVPAGTYTLSEQENTGWEHGYDLRGLNCTGVDINGDALEPLQINVDDLPDPLPAGVKVDPTNSRSLESVELTVNPGDDVTCTFSNAAREPDLKLSKESNPASGVTLAEGDQVTYTLVFDNSGGTGGAELNHFDHLADVLDDADWVDDSLRCGRDAEEGETGDEDGVVWGDCSAADPEFSVIEQVADPDRAASPGLLVKGTLPWGQKRYLKFAVKTKQNATDFAVRDAEVAPLKGYELRNYLTLAVDADGDPVGLPGGCDLPVGGEPSSCTEHPVLAWKTSKDSQPLDGAALHNGRDLHYRIRVERVNPDAAGDIQGIVVSDDLTQTFQYARWFPTAPVPGGAWQRGIYFYDADGQPFPINDGPDVPEGAKNRLPALTPECAGCGASWEDIEAADKYVPPPVFKANVAAPESHDGCPGPLSEHGDPAESPGPTNPNCFLGTWLLETAPFDLPSGAAVADVWFSVRVGFPTGVEHLGYEGEDYGNHTGIVWDDPDAYQGSYEGADGSVSVSSEPSGPWPKFWQPYFQVATTPVGFTNVAGARLEPESGVEPVVDAGESLTCAYSEAPRPVEEGSAKIPQVIPTGLQGPGIWPAEGLFNPVGQALYPQVTGAADGEFTTGDSWPVYPKRPESSSGMDYWDWWLPNPEPTQVPGLVPAECRVTQRVDANYFVIRKDLVYRDSQGRLDRAINMVGHELALGMELDTGGDPEVVPIQNICRVPITSSGGEVGSTEAEVASWLRDPQFKYHAGAGPRDCTNLETDFPSAEPLMCQGWDDSWAEPADDVAGQVWGENRVGYNESCAWFRPIAQGAQAGRYRAEKLPAVTTLADINNPDAFTTYVLTEMKAPEFERFAPGCVAGAPVVDGESACTIPGGETAGLRPLPGAQMQPDPVKLRVTAPDGKLQVPLANDEVQPACQIPYGGDVASLPPACINPTGFVMVLSDTALPRLPFTGGQWAGMLAGTGALILMLSLGGAYWWRRGHSTARHVKGRALST